MMKLNKKFHTVLSDYFKGQPHFFDGDTQKKANHRKCSEQPWQQTMAEMWDEVTDTLCNLDFIQAKACSKMTYDLVKDYHFALEGLPEAQPIHEQERKRQERMEKYTRDLITCARGNIPLDELEIPESESPWPEEKIDAEIERIKNAPTLLDRLMQFRNFLYRESTHLQNYSSELPNFALQLAWNHAGDVIVGNIVNNAIAHKISDCKKLLLRTCSTQQSCNPRGQFFMPLKWHSDDVTSVSITPDGKKAISGSHDKSCILWDLESAKPVQTLIGHSSWVTAVAITPDGKKAVSASWDNTCILWDLISGLPSKILIAHNDFITAVDVTPNGKYAVSSSIDNNCILWNLESGKPVKILKGHSDMVLAVTVTPDRKYAVSGSHDNTCIHWNLESGNPVNILKGHSSWVTAVGITPDAKKVISASGDNTCIVWDLISGRPDESLNYHSGKVLAVAVSPDGEKAISASDDKTCLLWDLKFGQPIKTLFGHSSWVAASTFTPDGKNNANERAVGWFWPASTFTPDGKNAITASGNSCIIWDLKSGQPDKTLIGHKNYVYAVSTTPDGEYLVSSSNDKSCIIWNLKTGKTVKTLIGHSERIWSVAVTPDGKNVISASDDNKCILWDLRSGKIVKILTGHTDGVNCVAITSDGKNVLSGSKDDTCIVWNLKSGQSITTFTGHSSWVNSVAITPDGKHAVSGSYDNTCIIWCLESGKLLAISFTKSPIRDVKTFSGGIFGGENSGGIFILRANKQLLCPDPAIVTARRVWDFEYQKCLPVSTDCPLCGLRFTPEKKLIDKIKDILRNCDIGPEESPCLKLPNEAWDEPGLFSNCPKCGKAIRFNPFIVDNSDRY